jgi:hypothetical protein
VLGLGYPQVVVTPGPGGAPFVNIWDVRVGAQLLQSKQVFGSSYLLGMHVSAATGVLALGAASQSGYVKILDGVNLSNARVLAPFGPSFTGGVTVAIAGGMLATGKASGTAAVIVYNASTLSQLTSIQAETGNPAAGYAGGVRLGWTQLPSGQWELLTGAGPGWPADTSFWTVGTWVRRAKQTEFNGWLNGVWLG